MTGILKNYNTPMKFLQYHKKIRKSDVQFVEILYNKDDTRVKDHGSIDIPLRRTCYMAEAANIWDKIQQGLKETERLIAQKLVVSQIPLPNHGVQLKMMCVLCSR